MGRGIYPGASDRMLKQLQRSLTGDQPSFDIHVFREIHAKEWDEQASLGHTSLNI